MPHSFLRSRSIRVLIADESVLWRESGLLIGTIVGLWGIQVETTRAAIQQGQLDVKLCIQGRFTCKEREKSRATCVSALFFGKQFEC